MKFLVDAQLPRRLALFLNGMDHSAKHTLDMPLGNRTSDTEIARAADLQGEVVVTKDLDFLNAHLLLKSPQKLLLITTGNLTNRKLLNLFEDNLKEIISALEISPLVELNQSGIVIHDG